MTVAEVDRIGEEQFPRDLALKAMREYHGAMRDEKDPQLRKEYLTLYRATKARALGAQVLDLDKVMKQAGLQPTVQRLPRLAIAPAHVPWGHVCVNDRGGAVFGPSDRIGSYGRVAGAVRFPDGTFAPMGRSGWQSDRPANRGRAMVPMVPPAARPPRALSNYFILWDAVWEPEPPRDPFLLKHLGGALYAIVFHWDLSPLEQAVMRGRLP